MRRRARGVLPETFPENLTQSFEIGPQIMMPDNKVFVFGADSFTALYNPTSGKWSNGPAMPISSGKQLDIADGPATVLHDGTILAAASPGVYAAPATFVTYKKKKIKMFATPADATNDSSYNIRLLMLPSGQVLETDDGPDVEVYNDNSHPMAGIAPKITSVPSSLTPGSTYTISGKNFNGFTQENFYGDDDQQAENYPLVQITNSSSGTVAYARTYGFSSMAIGAKGTTSASFVVPSNIGTGPSKVEVVTNGVRSRPVNVQISSTK